MRVDGRNTSVKSKNKLNSGRTVLSFLLASTVLGSASGAFAQVLTGVITSNASEGGTATATQNISGHGGAGITITGGTTTISYANLHNFTTVGGSGSGGGCGCGGLAFVGAGATLNLNTVTVAGDIAIGGLGNTSSLTGGSLNNLGASLATGGTASSGANGITWVDSVVLFGDGEGSGLDGTNAVAGASGATSHAVGGAGGTGGSGEFGWAFNPILTYQLLKDSQTLEEDSALLAKAVEAAAADATIAGDDAARIATDAESIVDDGINAVAAAAAATEFTDAAAAAAEEAAADEQLIVDGEKEAEDTVKEGADAANEAGDDAEVTALTEKVAADSDNVSTDTVDLTVWSAKNAIGQVGLGGAGGNGGSGGEGGFGLSGGAGGNGGAGGIGGGSAKGGDGGDGGDGGWGGFGAGGAAGGNGGMAGNGINPSRQGAAGGGGMGGFGGGNGASGTGAHQPIQTGGTGGSGFGGGVFVQKGGSLNISGTSTFSKNAVVGGNAAGIGGGAGGFAGTDLFIMTGSTVNLDPCAGKTNACGATITFNGTIADDSPTTLGGFGATTGGELGAGADIHIKSGIVAFNGSNTYSGITWLDGGVLQAADGTGLPTLSNLDFNGAAGGQSGAILETTGTFSRFIGTNFGQVQWTGSGGFSAMGGDLTVNLNNGDGLTWGSDHFVAGSNTLIFGTAEATNAVHFSNAIELVGQDNILVNGATGGATGAKADIAYLDGALSGSGGLIIDGTNGGLLVLSTPANPDGSFTTNSYTGPTTINVGGTLLLAPDPGVSGSIAGGIATSSKVTVNGTLDISGSTGASITTLAGGGSINLGAQLLTLTAAHDTFAGVIGGAGGLTVAGGTETLSGTNTYTGVTTINAGAGLNLIGTGSIATSTGVVDNGAFDISGTSAGAAITTLSGNGLVKLGSQYLTFTNASDTFAGVISGSGGITAAAGTETLTGTNTYTGTTTVNSGAALKLVGTGSIATSTEVAVNGTFDISGTSAGAAITTLQGTGNVALGAQTLTLTNANDTFGGVIGGTGNLTLAGGREQLTGTNTYTGVTAINPTTTLYLAGTGSIATSSEVTDNGTFDISATTAGASITTLSGNGVVTLGSQYLTLTAAHDTFAGAIGGVGGLTAAGGTETLTGTNTYTGTTTVNAGATLNLVGAGSIARSSEVAVNGTFDISGTSAGASITTLSGNGHVGLGAQTLTLTNANDIFAGVIGGTGNLTLASGQEELTGTNTYTGTTTIYPSTTLYLAGTGSIAASSEVADYGDFDISATTAGASITTLSGNGLVNLGSQYLTLTAASDTFAGVAQGTGGLTVAAGTENLTGTNIFTGTTTVNAGATLNLVGTGSIATSSEVAVNGVFDISATSAGTSIITLSGNGLVNLGSETLTLTNAHDTFAGVIADPPGGSLVIAAGTETLTGTNTYTGSTTINLGATLDLAGTGSIATSTEVTDNGVFDISQTTHGASIITLSGNGLVKLGAQYLTFTGAHDTFAGVTSGSGGLTAAAGTETLTGTNTYIGTTTTNAGATLALVGTGSIAKSLEVLDNGTFDISGTTAGASITTLSGNGVVNLGNQYLTLSAAHDTFNGSIIGTGGLTAAVGIETLTGTNTYTGVTTINSTAAIDLSGTGSIAQSSEVVDNGILDITQTTAGASITTLSGNGWVNLGTQYLTFTAAHDTFAGVTIGTGGLTAAGGTETLTGTNTYTGLTTINAGAGLDLVGTGSIAASSGVADNGTFDISGTTAGAAITTLSGNGLVNLGSQYLTFTAAKDTFAGVVQGAGGLTAAGGTQTLTGTNTYTGVTTINPGATLALAGTGSIAASSEVTDNGTFDISATSAGASITTLSGKGLVNLGSQYLTLTNALDTFAGVAQGTGGLTVAAGIENLTGTNTYTGATTVNGGATLNLVGTGSIAASSGVADNGTFDISATTAGALITTLSGSGLAKLGAKTLTLTAANTTFSGVASGTGGLTAAGGTETLTGSNTYTGATIINPGATLALGGTGSIAASSGVADNGTFDISGTSAGASITTLSGAGAVALGGQTLTLTAAHDTFSGAVGGTGGLAFTGGHETLTGTSTYSGGTSITKAIVTINGDAALGAPTGPVALTNGMLQATSNWTTSRNIALTGNADISATGSVVTLNGVLSGPGMLIADGGGSIYLNATNTYSGGTDIINKTQVFVGNDAALGAANAPVIIQDGALNATANLTTSRNIVLFQDGQLNSNGFKLVSNGEIDQSLNGTVTPLLTGGATLTGTLQFQTGAGFTVTAGSLLRGVGTFYTPLTVIGTVAPGNSPGTMTYVAPVTITAQGTLSIDVDGTGTGTGTGNFSRLLVTGAGNTFTAGGTLTPKLRGITGNATNTFTPTVGQSFTIVTASGGVAGQFQTLVEPTGLAAGTRFDAIYTPNALTLWVAPATYTNLSALGLTLTPNQAAVGLGLDALRPIPGQRTDTATTAVLQTLYGEQASALPAQLNLLSGVVYGEGIRYGLVKASETREAVSDVSNAEVLARASRKGDGMGTVWLTGQGSRTTLGSADAQFSGGMAGGWDRWWTPSLMAGIGGAGYDGQIRETVNSDRLKTSTVQVFAYGAVVNGANVFSAQAGGNYNSVKATRATGINGLVAQGKGNGSGYDFSAQYQRLIDVGGWSITPTARISADSVQRRSLAETGASVIGLNVASTTGDSVRSLIALGASNTWGGSDTRYVFSGKLGWGHEFSDVNFSTVQAFEGAPAAAFSTRTAAPGRDGAVVSLSQGVNLSSGARITFKYQGDLRPNQTSQAASLGVSFSW